MTYQPKLTELGCTRDSGARAEVSLMCEVRQGMQRWHVVRLNDISPSGFQIAWLPERKRDVPLRIRIPGLAMLTAEIRWERDKAVGCEFTEPLHVAVFDHIVKQAAAA